MEEKMNNYKQFKEELKNELIKQDNMFTNNPIFIVNEKIKYQTTDDNSCGAEWVDEDCDVIGSDDELIEHLKNDLEINPESIDYLGLESYDDYIEVYGHIFKKYYYIEIPRFKEAFLTRKAAEEYIEANRHNLTKPYICTNSMHRNYEMIKIRQYFMK